MSIWQQGYEAYVSGVSHMECPYNIFTEGFEWSEWVEGYDAAYCIEEGK